MTAQSWIVQESAFFLLRVAIACAVGQASIVYAVMVMCGGVR